MFPFVFQDKVRLECITDTDPNDRYWCFTKVDENLEGIGNWGYCGQSCSPINTQIVQEITTQNSNKCPTPNESEKEDTPCVFPFAFKGGLISECYSFSLKVTQKRC